MLLCILYLSFLLQEVKQELDILRFGTEMLNLIILLLYSVVCYITGLDAAVDNLQIRTLLQIWKLQKNAKCPHCNFDFMNKIEVRSNIVFYLLGGLNNTQAQTF